MFISTSTEDLLGKCPETRTPAQVVRAFGETRFRHLDYSFCQIGNDPDSPYYRTDGAWKREIEEAQNAAQEIGARFCVAHSHIDHEAYAAGGEARERTLRQLKNSIKACGMLGIPDLVIHGFFAGKTPEEQFESNRIFFEHFSEELCENHVFGLIENGGDAAYLLGAIRHSRNPQMAAVWDVGHANITATPQYENLTALGDALHTVHIHDNLGNGYFGKLSWAECDAHMMPYAGTVNYDEVLCALRDMNYRGLFNLEAVCALRQHDTYPWNPRREWPRDTRALEPSFRARILAEELLYENARSMLDAYGLLEESVHPAQKL